MHRPSLVLTLLIGLGLILAACGGSPSPSPGASSGGDPEPSQAAASEPAASQDGGGGGGIGTGTGSVEFDITGGYSHSDELPFLGDLAYFEQAGISYLVFGNDAADTSNAVIITLSDDGNVFQYASPEITIPAATCEWNITRHDANGAAGSFTCTDQFGVTESGGLHSDLDISGSFDAST